MSSQGNMPSLSLPLPPSTHTPAIPFLGDLLRSLSQFALSTNSQFLKFALKFSKHYRLYNIVRNTPINVLIQHYSGFDSHSPSVFMWGVKQSQSVNVFP